MRMGEEMKAKETSPKFLKAAPNNKSVVCGGEEWGWGEAEKK